MKNLINRLVCLIRGHKPYRLRYSYDFSSRANRKGGGNRRNRFNYKRKEYEDVCQRCGKTMRKGVVRKW